MQLKLLNRYRRYVDGSSTFATYSDIGICLLLQEAWMAEPPQQKYRLRADQVQLGAKYNQLLEQHAELDRMFDAKSSPARFSPGRSSLERGRWSVSEQPRGSTPERIVGLPPPYPSANRPRKKRPDSPFPRKTLNDEIAAQAEMSERVRLANQARPH